MFVHQSPRRHSERLQNAYEDGTDEDEQDLLQPADRYDQRERDRRSSPQDYHPRHTQLHTSSRMFADHHRAANAAPTGPFSNAPCLAHTADKSISETVHANLAHTAGNAALPPSERHSLPSYIHATSRHATRATQEPLEPLAAFTEAHGQRGATSFAATQSTAAACRDGHRQQSQRNIASFDPGGGRGLSSSSSEPVDRVADLEQQSAFYRNANYTRTTRTTAPPLVLSELPISKFSGDIRSYPMFRSRFLKTIGERPDLDPCEKFQYLIQHLDGEPLRIANGYFLTDDNYFKFLDRLEDQYGDTATLATLLARDFFTMKPVGQTTRDMQRFHEEALRLSDQMEQLGQDVNTNIIWRHILLSKIQLPLRIKIAENLGKDPMTARIQEILKHIIAYARLVEKCEAFIPWNTDEGDSRRRGLRHRPDSCSTSCSASTGVADHSSVADSSEASGSQRHEGPEIMHDATTRGIQRAAEAVDITMADQHLHARQTCPLCGLLHSAADCTVYDTTNQRLRRAMKLNLCLLCLREGHPAVSCPRRTTRPCSTCRRGQHNRALCKDAADANRRRDRRPSP
ncbi:Pao retrotransposon peptidase family protein, partial [Aphelenchoides avenae]